MATAYINVNINTVRSNKKHGTNNPAIRVLRGRNIMYGHQVQILGPSYITQSPDNPLACGSKVYIVTDSDVKVIRHENLCG